MNTINEGNNQGLSDLDRAALLRKEAERLESKERAKARIHQLMEISREPYYDRYLAQMLKDLESGKATPQQVEREAQRSYEQYKQRMAQASTGQAGTDKRIYAVPSVQPKEVNGRKGAKNNTVEFKIGIHVFSLIGALFVLTAFVIFSFHFLNGFGQGISLYAAAMILVLISEIILRKRMQKFSHVITGIGIGGLYIANIVNYLVLHTINGIIALTITVLIALGTILIGYKKDSAAIRLISLMGCYICFFPVKGFETELNFLVIVGMLFVINTFSAFLQNRKNRDIINIVHIVVNVIFTALLTGMAWSKGFAAVYLVGFVISSFAFISIMAYKQCREENTSLLFVFTCIGNGLCLFILFLVGNFGPSIKTSSINALFVHIIAEMLVMVICILAFLFWNREDGRRWAQIYYIVGAVLLLSSFSELHAEVIIALIAALLLTKLLNANKELMVLDCITVIWTGIMGLWLSDYWYCWLLAGALFLSALRIRDMHIYHEIVITVSILLIWWSQCNYFFDDFGLDSKWLYPISVTILLLFFMAFNHIPWLKGKKQMAYNVVCVVFSVLYCMTAISRRDYILSAVMMVLGTVAILVMFRKKFNLFLKRKYMVVAGFLTVYSFLGHFPTPVIVSIILMAIALGCVGIGFIQKDKTERICGLVMAIFVCGKLVLYDFREVEMIYRMIVFLVVGVLALSISFIYILLEKNMDKKRRELETNGGLK